MILQLLLAHAPDAFELQALASEYGADKNRFEKEASFCVHCGLCVRYCAEVKGKNAVGFVDRGIRKEISFVPEIASKECWSCKECFPCAPQRRSRQRSSYPKRSRFTHLPSRRRQGNRRRLIQKGSPVLSVR